MIIGNGKPEQIEDLILSTGYNGQIMTDPGLECFQAIGLKRTISGIASIDAVVAGVKAFRAGFRQVGVQGDSLQLGGAAVIGPGPRLHYHYRSHSAGDHPAVDDILEACLRAKEAE